MSTRDQLNDAIAQAIQLLIADSVLTNERIARSVGLNVVDLQTLGVILRSGAPMTPGEVAAATLLPSSSTTRVLDRLEARGYVTRAHDPADRRRIQVSAAADRVAADISRHYAPIVEHMNRIHADFSEPELALVQRYLEAIVRDPPPPGDQTGSA